MKISQKIPFGYTKTYFEFGDRKLDFLVTGERADSGFSVFYENISPDKSIKTVGDKWPVYLFIAVWLGCVIELCFDKSLGNIEQNIPARILIFGLLVGGMAMPFIQRKFMRNDATLIETLKGKIVILSDENQKTILNEIDQRRKAALKRKLGEVDLLNDPAKELAKFRQLKDAGIVTEAEFNAAMARLPLTVRA